MKKRTISKLKSLFGSKKGKRQQHLEQSAKSSRSHSPEPTEENSPSESYRPLLRTPSPSHVGPPPSPPVPTNPVAPVAPQPSGPLPLMPCLVCGRTFVPQSLAKHVKICEKMMAKKRKTFDSSRQRREGTDLEQYLPKNFGLPENSPFLEKSPPNTAKATPKPKPVSVRATVKKPMAELQKCPHCARAFGVRAFERHVEWCADKAKILPAAAAAPPPPHIADAKQRLNARTQYKAPLARARKSSLSRDKANSRSTSVDSSRGVSPPPPPREFGDYKQGRTRASESMSSNDCNEDGTPHVPVIRHSRTSQNNSGDVNVKARQARLARDLSSTRNNRDSKVAPIQQSSTDPNLPKQVSSNKMKNKINVKKKQQLKKLEEIANKYNERKEKTMNSKEKALKYAEEEVKSHIPILRKIGVRSKDKKPDQRTETNVCKLKDNKEDINGISSPTKKKSKLDETNTSTKKQHEKTAKLIKNKNHSNKSTTKESTMSLDSLDDVELDKNNKKNSPYGETEVDLLCPCVPCKIYNCPDQKKVGKRKSKPNVKVPNTPKNDVIPMKVPSIELLYKNPKINSPCDEESKEVSETQREYDDHNNNDNNRLPLEMNLNSPSCNHFNKNVIYVNEIKINQDENMSNLPKNSNISDENLNNISVEEFEESYEHDLSAEMFNDSVENADEEQKNRDISRHGSGDTYTKFSEDPADLEEFFNLTDKMIKEDQAKTEDENFIEDIDKLHTPNSNSIEALIKNDTPLENTEKHKFSSTLNELKNNLKDILDEKTDIDVVGNGKDDTNRKVHDMEHITVFGLKFYENEPIPSNAPLEENKPDFKLPSISETNNMMKKEQINRNKLSKNKYKNFNKPNRKNTEYKTFIVSDNRDDNSDTQSLSSEAPPLKLPRIEVKSSNNVKGENLFPPSVKRSTSLLDSIQKKTTLKTDSSKNRHKVDLLEQDIMQSLKDFDKFYENERIENNHSSKEFVNSSKTVYNATKKESRMKTERKNNKNEQMSNGHFTPGGRPCNDSAYSRLVSLNRISPSKLSLCNSKEPNGSEQTERSHIGSESVASHKDEVRSISSDEFLAMERSAEMSEPLPKVDGQYKDLGSQTISEKRASSRASSQRSPLWRSRQELSSSSSESSLHRGKEAVPQLRLSRFCHECGNKFPVDTAKFCIECGVKRLVV
ncbi:homeobox protein 2 isoform X6 [Battus philenor]|uniref:homeobox protein 2 isoform X6 n=1 Tax=Battus philenor TaxID=42288 RepID=UPI0035CF3B4C